MQANIDIQLAVDIPDLPTPEQFQLWVDTTLTQAQFESEHEPELTLRIVDEQEGRELNHTWRQKDYATNVLSFPFDAPPEVPIALLGDIIICANVVEKEASEQQKALESHWAHLVIHGVLHLLGYDHIDDEEAQQMENLEVHILKQLGYPNPY
ncbi:rRNA maturation RNase YbeY [Candidatus Albibeggiatoa sp. nov. NOAA]|uniref:rRNA maturation RNase YbeY n=1 Tax=Candidatus Albibeggiatoa sp. nov. NOAA TaxID=3162724 RepID=UPI0032FF8DB7|nr:rRNA maturation RNase YbeY [Thiotrichaceae bacterium]